MADRNFKSMNLSWLLRPQKGIPVLMYHKVWPSQPDYLTVTPGQLRQQWTWLANEGYRAMHLEEYLDVVAKNSTYYPPKTVLLTFDDGYHNNATEVYPLLQQLGWCATIFLIAGAVGNDPRWLATGADQKMTAATLLQLSPATVQYGYHGYQHEDFGRLTIEEVEQIVQQSASALQHAGIPMQPVLAYPYGARPKDPETLRRLKQMLQHNGLQAAFRIGNKVSTFPVTDRYEIKRIDIRGGDTLKNFKTKVTKGRLKPF